ncbi:MAG: hypothetical protein OEO17_14630 [Gemmatimonadota bacterium]|nr:hypothetical protein [Gemmatimonadota bacterium]MDH5615777.1 hypothetical protein [Acidimicrobiia bacterium]
MLDWLTGLTNEGITLMRLIVVLIAIVSIATVWYKTQALVPVLGAILVSGIAIWAVSPAGITQLEQWIGSDTAAAFVVPLMSRRRWLRVGRERIDIRAGGASVGGGEAT